MMKSESDATVSFLSKHIGKENNSPDEKEPDIYEFSSYSQEIIDKKRNQRKRKITLAKSSRSKKKKLTKFDEDVLKMCTPISAKYKQSGVQNDISNFSFSVTPKIFKHKHENATVFHCSTPLNHLNKQSKQQTRSDESIKADTTKRNQNNQQTVANKEETSSAIHRPHVLKDKNFDRRCVRESLKIDKKKRNEHGIVIKDFDAVRNSDTHIISAVIDEIQPSHLPLEDIQTNSLSNEESINTSEVSEQKEVQFDSDGYTAQSENLLNEDRSVNNVANITGQEVQSDITISPQTKSLLNEKSEIDSGFESVLFNDIDNFDSKQSSNEEESLEVVSHKTPEPNESYKYECTYSQKSRKSCGTASRNIIFPSPLNVNFWLNKSKTFSQGSKENTEKEQKLLRNDVCAGSFVKAQSKKRKSLKEINKRTNKKHLQQEKKFNEAAEAMNAVFREVEKFQLMVE